MVTNIKLNSVTHLPNFRLISDLKRRIRVPKSTYIQNVIPDRYQTAKEIYQLIKDGNDDELYEKYPMVKIYRKLLDLVIEAFFSTTSEEYTAYFVTGVFFGTYMSADKLYTKTKEMEEDFELFKQIVHLRTQQDDYMKIIFNPVVYNKHANVAAYQVQHIMWSGFDIDVSNIEIHNEKIKKFFDVMRMVKNNYPHLNKDVETALLILYGHMNDNYEYLYRYLDNYDFYQERLMLNNYSDHDRVTVLSEATNKMFINIPKIFIKYDKNIK